MLKTLIIAFTLALGVLVTPQVFANDIECLVLEEEADVELSLIFIFLTLSEVQTPSPQLLLESVTMSVR